MVMATLAPQIANALVHGPARGRHEAGHAGHDAMVARRNHVGTRTQNGNQLKHVVVVGSKDRRTRNPRSDLAAGSGIKPFHRHKYRKYAMTLNERLSRLRESGDVMLVFSVDFLAGLKKLNYPVLAVLVRASGCACDVFPYGSVNRAL